MTMVASCALAYGLVLAGPALASVYVVSVLCFFASWHECTWDYVFTNKGLALRLGILVAAGAVSAALCQTEAPVAAIVPIGVFSLVLSFWLLHQTRLIEVEGGPVPKFESMKGKVVFVTGANAGIGKETVRELVALGATVILGCRSERRAQEAMEEIQSSISEQSHLHATSSQMHFCSLDLSNLSSVRQAAQTVLDMKLPLDVLINNAGVMMGTKKVTGDGCELMMQANHLGHFLLTKLLLPKLLKSQDPRVVTLTSSTYRLASSGMDLDDLFCDSTRAYTMFSQYAQTKLANILFAKELARRNGPKLQSFAAHPGLVRTDVVRNMPFVLKYGDMMFGFLLKTLQKAPRQGAYTSVWCATGKSPAPNGAYLVNSKAYPTNQYANDEEVAKKLWDLSEKLVKQ